MTVHTLTVNNFRCFASARFSFSDRLTIIQGSNGSGKTSLLEAIHYSCYLKSFRTHSPLELSHDSSSDESLAQAHKSFMIKIVTFANDSIVIGVTEKKRSFKINGIDVKNYSKLIDNYKVVTFIEEDLSLIKGYPEQRRTFFDQAIYVQDPNYYIDLRTARKNIDQRNSMLNHGLGRSEEYLIWVEDFVKINKRIISRRRAYIQELMLAFSQVCLEYGTDSFLQLVYKEKRSIDTTSSEDISHIINDEHRSGRVQYGFHLDDIEFSMYNRNSRAYASRGQQKLAIILLKVAQSRVLIKNFKQGHKLVFLLDDFLTDFDTMRIDKIVALLFTLDIQIIITIPQKDSFLFEACSKYLRGADMVYIALDDL